MEMKEKLEASADRIDLAQASLHQNFAGMKIALEEMLDSIGETDLEQFDGRFHTLELLVQDAEASLDRLDEAHGLTCEVMNSLDSAETQDLQSKCHVL